MLLKEFGTLNNISVKFEVRVHPRACLSMPVELREQLSDVGLRDLLGPPGFVVTP